VIAAGFAGGELHEDAPHMPPDGLRAQGEAPANALVRAALGYQGEHLTFTPGEQAERPGRGGTAEEPGDDGRVGHAFALVPPGERVGEHTHAGHAFLAQIADPALVLLDQPHRVARLEVAGPGEQPSEHHAGIDGDQRVALLTGPATPSHSMRRADHPDLKRSDRSR